MADAPRRLFRLRLRPGRAMLTTSSDRTPGQATEAGDEVVLSEEAAAFLIRQRAVDIIEVVEPEGDPSDEPTQ